MELHWTDHLYFIIVGILIPLRAVLGEQPKLEGVRFSTAMKLQLYWGNNLYLWLIAAAAAGAWWWNDRPWSMIGLEWPWLWPKGGPLLVMVLFAALYVWDTLRDLNAHPDRASAAEELQSSIGFLPVNGREYFHFIFLALTAGICEEFIFRGYFIRYFQCLFGQDETATLAILAPSVIFGLVHLYQGWHAVVKITAMAVMFGFVFVHTQSLWLLMAVHALVDLIGGALGWWLVGEDKRN